MTLGRPCGVELGDGTGVEVAWLPPEAAAIVFGGAWLGGGAPP